MVDFDVVDELDTFLSVTSASVPGAHSPSGVQMEAKSVEDGGTGVTFNVYVYNVQPYVVINYETGESYQTEELATPEGEWAPGTEAEVTRYIT